VLTRQGRAGDPCAAVWPGIASVAVCERLAARRWVYPSRVNKIVDKVIANDYFSCIPANNGGAVKQSEFRRWLAAQGATFKEGANHTKVYLNGEQSTIPRHHSSEIGEGLRKAIIKQLGLK
jgi:mRNA interferase HicA